MKRLGNQKGQMSIFIALIFQVLFVFFAMTINIGLLVHDKINLQNAADLAAYYGARKQAEMLNAIAHTNFQMRQNWKLLAWRVRGLGDSGRANHPWTTGSANEVALDLNVSQSNEDYPSICTNHLGWREVYYNSSTPQSENQNVCYSPAGLDIPELTVLQAIAGAPGGAFNAFVQMTTESLKSGQQNACSYYGVTNWLVGAHWIAQFKTDMLARKRVIRSLADELTKPEFTDLQGGSFKDGVKKTLLNNLTRSNFESVNPDEVQVLNSLSLKGSDSSVWLNDIRTRAYIYYSDFIQSSTGNTCTLRRRPLNFSQENDFVDSLPDRYLRMQNNTNDFFVKAINSFKSYVYDPPLASESDLIPSVGFEKNPWMMAYVGVKVSSAPRRPFSPFGRDVVLTARAFAKPFGGRIGPWMYNSWEPTKRRSSGTSEDLVDKLLPPALEVEVDPNVGQDRLVPNYSRYPGDQLGLRSERALSALYNEQLKSERVSYFYFPVDKNQSQATPNSLSSDPVTGEDPFLRSVEAAVIAPNVFDITYYSIDPRFYENYQPQSAFSLAWDLGTPFKSEPVFNVIKQLRTFAGSTFKDNSAQISVLNFQKAPWKVTDWRNLLTGWVPQSAGNYDQLNEEAFGRCVNGGEGNIPGSCQIGGRTGYSVKIVSKSFLGRPDLKLGGGSWAAGINNPPPPGW